MEFTKENFKGIKLYVAIPMYNENCNGYVMNSVMFLQKLCFDYDIEVKFSFRFNESLVSRARNLLVDNFIRETDYTHFLFIDSDVEFNAYDVLVMLTLDKEIIGAPYPIKNIFWNQIKEAIIKNPDIPVEELPSIGSRFVLNLKDGETSVTIDSPVIVSDVGTGYMLIKREVFDKIREAYPENRYTSNYQFDENGKGLDVFAYFDCGIDKDKNIYLSEDYYFNKLWRDIGGDVWYCPWMQTFHHGTYSYPGNIPLIAKNTGEL